MTQFRILAVCTANICRSAAMEILLRNQLDPGRFAVESAGVQGWRGAPVDSMVVLELARFGATADGFSSQSLKERHVLKADLVLTATRAHRADVLGRHPSALSKTFTLREFARLVDGMEASSPAELVQDAYRRRSEADADIDLLDPFRRPPSVHRVVADQIALAVAITSDRLEAAR